MLLVAVLVTLVGALASCGGGDEFEDRTAKVTIYKRTNTFEITSCGLDQETLFVVGRAEDGSILQAVVGVTFAEQTTANEATAGADPDEAAVPDSSGLTVGDEGSTFGAFGAESWSRRGGTGAAPGLIGSARVRGSRIQMAGRLVPLDDQDRPVANGSPVDFELDARCDDASA